MEAVITAMEDVVGLITPTIGIITGNPILLFFLAAGLLPLGFYLFRCAKRAASSGT